MATFTTGKAILTLIALITMIGPYLADWNETHVLNPTWPPHARFHNGQTMSLGAFLGASILYYLYIASAPTPQIQLTHLNFMLLLVHAYYVPAASGILYPGALWMDPEFGDGAPQMKIFPVFLAIGWVGWWVERGRVRGEMMRKGR